MSIATGVVSGVWVYDMVCKVAEHLPRGVAEHRYGGNDLRRGLPSLTGGWRRKIVGGLGLPREAEVW